MRCDSYCHFILNIVDRLPKQREILISVILPTPLLLHPTPIGPPDSYELLQMAAARGQRRWEAFRNPSWVYVHPNVRFVAWAVLVVEVDQCKLGLIILQQENQDNPDYTHTAILKPEFPDLTFPSWEHPWLPSHLT